MTFNKVEKKSKGDIAIEELADSLYKDSRHIKGLKIIFDKLKPRPNDEEIIFFCDYWMKKEDHKGNFPRFSDVEKFMKNLPSRKELNKLKTCFFQMCDGTGHIELKQKGAPDNQYIYRKWCKCVSEIAFEEAMKKYVLTDWQCNYTNTQSILLGYQRK